MSQIDTKAGKKANKNELRDTVVVIVEALLIALVFRTFLYQPFSIPTASMQSTMMIGDYFLASKFTWGLGKYSFPITVPLGDRILQFSEPQQGDIARFRNEPTGEGAVKRIIGLPGDKIRVKEGRLYINGVMLATEEITTGEVPDVAAYPVPVSSSGRAYQYPPTIVTTTSTAITASTRPRRGPIRRRGMRHRNPRKDRTVGATTVRHVRTPFGTTERRTASASDDRCDARS